MLVQFHLTDNFNCLENTRGKTNTPHRRLSLESDVIAVEACLADVAQ